MTLSPVLLIAYQYPPHNLVGSRRWTKLSRELANRGHQVHVLTVNWSTQGPDTLAEVDHSSIHIHRLPAMGPRRHPHMPKPRPARVVRRWQLHLRLMRRLRGSLARRFQAVGRELQRRGLWPDGRLWGWVLVPFALRLVHNERIGCIIATGPPHYGNWWAARLKRHLPDVPLIQDLRDPWASLPPQSYSATRRNPERVKALEAEALDAADIVVTVTDGYKRLLEANTASPVVVIPNGYDAQEMPELSPGTPRPFKLVYAGSVNGGRIDAAVALLEAARDLYSRMPELQIEFWGPMLNRSLRTQFSDLMETGVLKTCGQTSGDEIMRIVVQEAFACIQLTAREMPEALSTKIYDYAQSRRPILCINYGGEIDQLFARHKLGLSVNGDNSEAVRAALSQLYELWLENPAAEADSAGIEAYDYRNIVLQYSTLIEELAAPTA